MHQIKSLHRSGQKQAIYSGLGDYLALKDRLHLARLELIAYNS